MRGEDLVKGNGGIGEDRIRIGIEELGRVEIVFWGLLWNVEEGVNVVVYESGIDYCV